MIPLLKPINGFEQVTFSQAIRLTKPVKVDGSIVKIGRLISSSYEANLDTIANTLDRINDSIVQYASSTPRYKKILHLFTGRYLKMRLLRRALPSLINVVNLEAMALFKIQHWDLQENDKLLAAAVQTQYSTSTPFLQSYHKIKVYPTMPVDKGKTEAGVKLTPEASRKWQILEHVHTLFLGDNPEGGDWDYTARMINKYIMTKKDILSKTGDVTLPRFFHTTRVANLPLIIQSKKIKQMNAPMGLGAYVSTGDEGGDLSAYGSKTFALTEEAIYPHPGSYFPAHSSPVDKKQLWVCVEHEINITEQTVAHFVAEDDEKCREDALTFLNSHYDIPIITREASQRITALFNQTLPRRDLPATWQGMPGYDISFLTNVHPHYSRRILN